MTGRPRLSAIVAIAENGVIGRDNDLPWRLSADLRRFRRITTGHSIVMGRKTFESIGRPLPDRTNIVITRDRGYRADGIVVAHSLDGAIEHALEQEGADEIFVVGGAAVFGLALPRCDRVYVTLVHAEVDGDVTFPLDSLDKLELVHDEPHEPDERNEYAYSFRVYEQRNGRG